MNEIIEGYNVNGLCICCLSYRRELITVNEFEKYYKLFTNIEIPPEINLKICRWCAAIIKRFISFEKTSRSSFNVLMKYSENHQFLNPKDFEQYSRNLYSCEQLYKFAIPQYEENKSEVHVDRINISNEHVIKNERRYDTDCDIEVKEDLEDHDVKSEIYENDYDNEEDNVCLMLLKSEKGLKRRSKRKMKKLPKEDSNRKNSKLRKSIKENPDVKLVEVDWTTILQLKEQDLNDPQFQKLKFKCKECLLGFIKEEALTKHRQRKHSETSEKPCKCKICGECTSYDNVDVHSTTHLIAYRCNQCEHLSVLPVSIARHMKTHLKDTQQCYTCPFCDLVFNSSYNLQYHKTSCKEGKPQCDCCGKVYANKITLRNHLLSSATKEKRDSAKINCTQCNKVFSSKKSFLGHVAIHSGVQHPCQNCGKLFQWKRNLSRHMRNHRDKELGTPYKCHVCNKRFASKEVLVNHMKLSKNHGEYAYRCDECDKSFPIKQSLDDHVDWDHKKKLKYTCEHCSKSFKTSKVLRVHVNNVHLKLNTEPEGSHLCDICGKDYTTVKRLKCHVWAVHKERPTGATYKCHICPSVFNWKNSIYKHIKMVHHKVPARNKMFQMESIRPATRAVYNPESNIQQTHTNDHIR